MDTRRHKRKRMLRSRWDVESERKRPELVNGYSLRWSSSGQFVSILFNNELVVYNVQGKPCAANGLLSTQVYHFKPSYPPAKQKPKDAAWLSPVQVLTLSESGVHMFSREKMQYLTQHEWSPSALISGTNETLASTSVVALLYASGKLSICTMVDNSAHPGIKETTVFDEIELHLPQVEAASTLCDTRPTCMAWRPHLLDSKAYLAVAGSISISISTSSSDSDSVSVSAEEPSVQPCMCLIQVNNQGEGEMVGGEVLDMVGGDGGRITALKWVAEARGAGKEGGEMIVSGHCDSAVCVWKAELSGDGGGGGGGGATVAFVYRIEPFTGFPTVHLFVHQGDEEEKKYVAAVSGNMAKTWVVDWEASREHGEVICRNNINGLVCIPKETVKECAVMLLLDAMGLLSCWALDGGEADLERLPEDLAQEWKDSEPNEFTFDPSKCSFPSYGIVVSPNDALILTVHIQVDINEAMTGKKANPLCVIVAHPTNTSLEHMLSSGRNLNDVAWRLEYDLTTDDSTANFGHDTKIANMITSIANDADQTRRVLCALGGLGVTWPKDVGLRLDAFRRATQLKVHMTHVTSLLKTLVQQEDRNDEETLCLLLCCDLVCWWANTKESSEVLEQIWSNPSRLSTIKKTYIKLDKPSVQRIDSPETLPCRDRSMYVEEQDPPDGKITVNSPDNTLGLVGTVSNGGDEFTRCQLSLFGIKGGDDCVRCPTCETLCLLSTPVRPLHMQHNERICILCGTHLVLTSYVSLVLNAMPACRDAHVLDRA